MNSILKTLASNWWLKIGLIVTGFASLGLKVYIGWWCLLVMFLIMCVAVILSLINIDAFETIEMAVVASKNYRKMKKERKE